MAMKNFLIIKRGKIRRTGRRRSHHLTERTRTIMSQPCTAVGTSCFASECCVIKKIPKHYKAGHESVPLWLQSTPKKWLTRSKIHKRMMVKTCLLDGEAEDKLTSAHTKKIVRGGKICSQC